MIINERLLGTVVEVRPKTDSTETVTMIFQGLCETQSYYSAAVCENENGNIFFFPLDQIRFLDTEDVIEEIRYYTTGPIPEECFNGNLINCKGIFNKDKNEVNIVRIERICCGYKDYGIDGTIAEYEFVAFDKDDNQYRCGELYWDKSNKS